MPVHNTVQQVEVSEDQAGQRLDNFLLARLKGVPKSHVYRLIRSGQVRVNSGRVRPSHRLAAGDRVRIPPVRTAPKPAAGRVDHRLEGRIIYEDDGLLVLDKPAGLAVHGGSGISLGLIENLRATRPDAPYLDLAHRLDRSTSGCLVVAKKRSALRTLHELFRTGAVGKQYLALVRGQWDLGAHQVSAPLEVRNRQGGERHVQVSEQGKPAITRFRPADFFQGATLLDVSIETGRTHQIRVHAAYAGHPVAGDGRYGDTEFNNRISRETGLRRLFLHAHRLTFSWQGKDLDLSTPLPSDLAAVVNRLQKPRRKPRR